MACLDSCPNASQIPGFCKLNGCLSLDPKWWWRQGRGRMLARVKDGRTKSRWQGSRDTEKVQIISQFIYPERHNPMSASSMVLFSQRNLSGNFTETETARDFGAAEKTHSANPRSHSTACLMTPLTLQCIPVMPFIVFPKPWRHKHTHTLLDKQLCLSPYVFKHYNLSQAGKGWEGGRGVGGWRSAFVSSPTAPLPTSIQLPPQPPSKPPPKKCC